MMLSNGFVLFWFVIGSLIVGLGIIRSMASLSTPGVPGEDHPGPVEMSDEQKA